MNSSEVRCFLSAAKNLNFSRAADELFLSRQAVSRLIINLETELNTKLFMRNNQTLTLTDAGILYYDFFLTTQNRWTALQQSLLKTASRGVLRIAYLEGLNITQTLLDRFFSLGDKHHLKIEMLIYDMHDLLRIVEAGTTDFILTYSGPRLDMIPNCDYVSIEKVSMVLVVSKMLIKDTNEDTCDFEHYPVVTWKRKNQSEEAAIQHCIQHCLDFGFRCHDVYVASDRNNARLEIENGHGVGICTAIDQIAFSPSVQVYPLSGTSEIACLWNKLNPSPDVQIIAKELQQETRMS